MKLHKSIIVLTALVLGSCAETTSSPEPSKREPIPVTVETILEIKEPLKVRRSARIRSRVDIRLVCESPGLVLERPIRAGSQVKAGAVIARLSTAAEQAALKAARARLSGLVNERTPLEMRKEAESAVEQAQEMLRRRTVVAPFDGIIDRYDVEVGDYLLPGAPVARLVDPTKLWGIATVLEEEVLRVREGAPITFTIPAAPGVSFSGGIIRRGNAALDGSGQFEVEFDVNHDARVLPGFIATVSIPLVGEQAVRALSRDAVFTRHGTPRVFVVAEKEGKSYAEERTITLRSITGDPGRVDVLSGVEIGEDVVTRGRIGLLSGDPLLPKRR